MDSSAGADEFKWRELTSDEEERAEQEEIQRRFNESVAETLSNIARKESERLNRKQRKPGR